MKEEEVGAPVAGLGVPLTAVLSWHWAAGPLTKHRPPPRLRRAPAHQSIASPVPLDPPPPSGELPLVTLHLPSSPTEASRPPAATLTARVPSCDPGSTSRTPAGLGVAGVTQEAGARVWNPFWRAGGSAVTGVGAPGGRGRVSPSQQFCRGICRGIWGPAPGSGAFWLSRSLSRGCFGA